MIKVNWKREYKKEFKCYHCDFLGITLAGVVKGKKTFRCRNCGRNSNTSSNLPKKYLESRLAAYGFICPNNECKSKQMKLRKPRAKTKNNKNVFKCLVCNTNVAESIDLTRENINRYGCKSLPVKPFIFEDDEWDFRAINASKNLRGYRYIMNFKKIPTLELKQVVKKHIYHLCQLNKSLGTVTTAIHHLTHFSIFLAEKNTSIHDIGRETIIAYMSEKQFTNAVGRNALRIIRQLFKTGIAQGWLLINPDIIRDSDYPKKNISNPDPIPDSVREQIEKNLYKLPEPIARMWIVCFFAAMRPSELAFLKKDCLEQIGEKWKLGWSRTKGKKIHEHSVPITATIAKVVQEQEQYIEGLWGKDWQYLFCHYQNISQSDSSHPKLKPVKKLIPSSNTALELAIRTLIKTENILDDNGQPGKFLVSLIRETRLTELFLKGHDLSVVSAWAGHRQLATTANFYTQVTCEQIEKEVGHIQSALVNADGKKIYYESMPKSFWDNPVAHELEVAGTHVNTPIYGYCGLDLDEECDKFRACYTCRFFVAKPEKLSQYVNLRDELRKKQESALANGHGVLVEQFARQADQLDKIILSLQEAA